MTSTDYDEQMNRLDRMLKWCIVGSVIGSMIGAGWLIWVWFQL